MEWERDTKLIMISVSTTYPRLDGLMKRDTKWSGRGRPRNDKRVVRRTPLLNDVRHDNDVNYYFLLSILFNEVPAIFFKFISPHLAKVRDLFPYHTMADTQKKNVYHGTVSLGLSENFSEGLKKNVE